MSQGKGLQRFVVLSNARSGSNMLQSMLDEHPQVTCFGEAFNPSYGKGYANWVCKSFLRRMSDKYLRDYCMGAYLDSLCTVESRGDIRAVGFKVLYPGQFNRCPSFRHYWQTHEFKIVRLIRRNLLRRYVSSMIANKENRWSASEHRGERVTVMVDIDDLHRAFSRMEAKNRGSDALANEFQNIMVDYEQLVSNRDGIMRNIFEFLGVGEDEAAIVAPRTAKQNPEKLDMLIENYDEVRAALMGSQYEWFLEESSS